MRKIIFIFFTLVFVGCGIFYFATKDETDSEKAVVMSEVVEKKESKYTTTEYVVNGGDVFTLAMNNLGFGYSEALGILEAASSTYDFTKIKPGKVFRLFTNDRGERVKLEYEPSAEEIVVVDLVNPGFSTSIVPITYTIETGSVSGAVSSSLWNAGLGAGMSEDLIIKFADVFAWTIDFAVQVQPGDSFKVLYEKRFRDGVYVGVGHILAGEFINNGKSYKGFRFTDAEDKAAYYSETGEALQKQFLKAPLEFRRITSGYTYARFDPINGKKAPHLAIDYAAAIGTPIMAVGDGTVEFAGWNSRGFGNFVSIRHNDTYTTEYAHMSALGKGIKRGVRVTQGQVIGYVGSTGHSTGPHLHYQIKKNGMLVNPLEIELPPGDPIVEEKRLEFEAVMTNYNQLITNY